MNRLPKQRIYIKYQLLYSLKYHKNISEDTQEMPQSLITALPRHQKMER